MEKVYGGKVNKGEDDCERWDRGEDWKRRKAWLCDQRMISVLRVLVTLLEM